MDTASFDYGLPPERIAQTPVEPRDAARLLVDRGPGAEPDDRHVRDLVELLQPGDLLVVNETRVLPARLGLVKDTGGHAEVFLLEPHAGADIAVHGPQQWVALVRPGRRLRAGTIVRSTAPDVDLTVEIGHDLSDGSRIVEVRHAASVTQLEALHAAGSVPLPPYITTPLDDPERYQTTFSEPAAVPDSVAAPTAGLHLTSGLLDRVRSAGIEIATVELAVGLGTFRPIAADTVEDHAMHAERYRVDPPTWDRIVAAGHEGRRVVAVGTTTVRTLESVAATRSLHGRTELFIHGDYRFQVVDVLMTNFHQPRSSLLVLIDAFAGPRWRDLYAHALDGPYRFLSFGDAMLLTRRDHLDGLDRP